MKGLKRLKGSTRATNLPIDIAEVALLSVFRNAHMVGTTFHQSHHINQAVRTEISAKRYSQLIVNNSWALSWRVEFGQLSPCVTIVCKTKRIS